MCYNTPMIVLGIETSCDETGIAILDIVGKKATVRANVLVSQAKLHEKYGGVVPEVAARQHLITLMPALNEALEKAKLSLNDIDTIAVTAGPGLVTALISGVETARTLAMALKKKLVAVNHMEAHILSNWLPEANTLTAIKLPALCLTVSGGHTELVLIKKIGTYKVIGRTRDDAAGEAFDKVAQHLDLGYPGGPIVSQRALKGKTGGFKLPRPMLDRPGYEFSFAGLKTAVVYSTLKNKLGARAIDNLCADFQQAVVDTLVGKTMRAAAEFKPKTILLAGGVAANKQLRGALEAAALEKGIAYHQPRFEYCTDNGAMIAITGYFKARANKYTRWQDIEANPQWEIK